MWKTVRPNDLVALVLLWGLVIIGCLIGDAQPARRVATVACPPVAAGVEGG